MTVKIYSSTRLLYEQDFNLWLGATVERLRYRRFNEVDIENLIEEIELMGRRGRRALESYLENIIEHCLKLVYWDFEKEMNRSHWLREIIIFRNSLTRILRDSPSLKPYLGEVFSFLYTTTAEGVKKSLKLDVPGDSPFTIASLVDPDWFPIDIENDEE